MKLVLRLIFLFCALSPTFASQGEVHYIPPRDYFNTLIQEIEKAQESIVVYLYQFTVNPEHSGSLPLKIAEALIRAKKRGVPIEIVLDQNVDFTAPPSERSWVKEGKNWAAYTILSANGISVTFDPPTTYLHSKLAVFDYETVLLGSTNWSQVSMLQSREANLLLRSKEIAQKILEDFSTLPRQTPPEEGPTIQIPSFFLENREPLGQMMHAGDKLGFNLYLILLKMAWEKGESELDVDTEELGELLGLEGNPSLGYQRGLWKAYRRLEKRYRLIHYKTTYGKGVHVQLRSLSNPDQILSLNDVQKIPIPLEYWSLGWNKRLSLPGKIFYLLSLYYSSISEKKPQWTIPQSTIAEKYRISVGSLHNGIAELRRANLIEVMHDPLSYDPRTKEIGPRRANIYITNPLYDPRIIESGRKEMEGSYGAESVARALKFAGLVYEDSDLKFIEELIQLETKYGREKMDLVYSKLKRMSPDNPKRSAGYFIRTVKSL